MVPNFGEGGVELVAHQTISTEISPLLSPPATSSFLSFLRTERGLRDMKSLTDFYLPSFGKSPKLFCLTIQFGLPYLLYRGAFETFGFNLD